MVIIIIVNLILSLWIIPQYVGSKRKIGFWWSLVACFFLSPLVGGTITFLSPKLEEYKSENIKKVKERNKLVQKRIKKKENLESLRDSKILTDEEYQNKIKILKKEKKEQEEQQLIEEIKKRDEYKRLKNLYDDNVLTKEEFLEKKDELFKNFLKLPLIESVLIGKWVDNEKFLYFSKKGNFRYYSDVILSDKYFGGIWEITNNDTIKLGNNEIKVLKISLNKIVYTQNNKEYSFKKIKDNDSLNKTINRFRIY